MSRISEMNMNEALKDLSSYDPLTVPHEQLKSVITVRCTEEIVLALKSVTDQINKSSKSSDKLGRRIFWLNIVLALATIIAAFATFVIALKT